MKSLSKLTPSETSNLRSELKANIRFILTDIDDTLTTEGQLPAVSYTALWNLKNAGYKVIPITGRPAGWSEMIARLWPVEAVVGENGGFYFRYTKKNTDAQKKMHRWFFADKEKIKENKNKLNQIENEVLNTVPGSAVASDQFCRLMDLAIDFCEDVPPLPLNEVERIVTIFNKHGAIAKVSSIHVNGWFGNYNKISTTLQLLQNEFQISEQEALKKCIFVGDSPNDEPMFEKFPYSFGVANIKKFTAQMQSLPAYIANHNGGEGFSEIASLLID